MEPTTDTAINALRGEITSMIYDTADLDYLRRARASLRRLRHSRHVEPDEPAITTDEFDQIKESIAEFYEAKRTGKPMKTAEELYAEL